MNSLKANARWKAHRKRHNIALNVPKTVRKTALLASISPRSDGLITEEVKAFHNLGYPIQVPPVSRKRRRNHS